MKNNFLLVAACLVVLSVFCFTAPLLADADGPGESEPLWEIGLFAGGATIPAYRGSEESTGYAFVLPYAQYRGDVLNIDRDGITGKFFKSERITIDTSLFVEFNDNDEQRDGMPELDPVIMAIGPALKYYFARHESSGYDLYLDLPIRAAVSGNLDGGLDMEYRGLQAKLNLFYENTRLFGSPRLELVAALGVAYFNNELASYYYDVEEQFATAQRPAFQSDAGYAGASGTVSLLYHWTNRIAVRSYLRVDNLNGTAFEDSPLVTSSTTMTAGVAVLFSLFESKKRVQKD